MKDSLKLLRRRPLSNDPAIKAFLALSSCTKISQESVKDSIIRKGKDEIKDSCHCSSSDQSSASNLEEETLLMQHPAEPEEIDRPIRCPPPEPSIIQDGRKCGQKLGNVNLRRGQLRFLTESEIEDLHQNDVQHIRSGDETHMVASISAAETSIVNLLE